MVMYVVVAPFISCLVVLLFVDYLFYRATYLIIITTTEFFL